MTRTIEHRGKSIRATDETPLTVKGLAQFLGYGRQRVYDEMDRGYVFEFGNETTARHFFAWLRLHPRPTKRKAAASKRAHALSQLH